MAEVTSLGYARIGTTDLAAWEKFATELVGLQVGERTESRIRLRNDDKLYRLEIVAAESEGTLCLGWEVKGHAELQEMAAALEAEGYEVTRESVEVARERGVSELISFLDPDGMRLEIYYGQMVDKMPFVSPTGARFFTEGAGMGHVFQLVSEEEPFRHLYLDILGCKLSDYIDFGTAFTGTFTHCNPRHHSYAFAHVPGAPTGINHFMFEVTDLDPVGRAYDRVLKEKLAPLKLSLGRHSNDQMISFYVDSPSGFQIEYGYGGLLIEDEESWRPVRYDVPAFWGHELQTQPS